MIINENNKKMSNINSIKELESYINDNIVGRVALISEATSLDSMPIEEFNLKILPQQKSLAIRPKLNRLDIYCPPP